MGILAVALGMAGLWPVPEASGACNPEGKYLTVCTFTVTDKNPPNTSCTVDAGVADDNPGSNYVCQKDDGTAAIIIGAVGAPLKYVGWRIEEASSLPENIERNLAATANPQQGNLQTTGKESVLTPGTGSRYYYVKLFCDVNTNGAQVSSAGVRPSDLHCDTSAAILRHEGKADSIGHCDEVWTTQGKPHLPPESRTAP